MANHLSRHIYKSHITILEVLMDSSFNYEQLKQQQNGAFIILQHTIIFLQWIASSPIKSLDYKDISSHFKVILKHAT